MRMLSTIFMALMVPFIVLNSFGGIVSGIWLAILREWQPIAFGVIAFVSSTFLLGIALLPGMIFVVPAGKCIEMGQKLGAYILLFLGSLYTFVVIALWCLLVMQFFLIGATKDTQIPLMLWSYGVAIGPLSYMASKDQEVGASSIAVAFSSLAYVTGCAWILMSDPTVFGMTVLFACFLGVGMILNLLMIISSSIDSEY